MRHALFKRHFILREILMSTSGTLEIRRFQRRGDAFPIYYVPEMAIRAHDHRYLLRLISDRIAWRAPGRFSLLPQFRTLDPSARH